MKYRIALAGIYHESNTFLPGKTTWEDFENGHLFRGSQIREEYQDAYHEIGGILEVFDASEVEIVPLFFAEATPGGIITRETCERLISEILEELESHGPWDGVQLCTHGAAVGDGYPDMDGSWLSRVRQLTGNEIPIVCSLDPHANVSPVMAEATDALVSYATNPHLDQRETGMKAARMMLDHLDGKVRLTQALYQTRVSISIEQQATSEYPCTLLYDQANQYLERPDVLSVSIILGFPYSDVEVMGSSVIVVTNHDAEIGEQIARTMGEYLEENRHLFVGERIDAESAVLKSTGLESPVLLLDMGDNVGGGSPGDGTIILHALYNYPDIRYFVCLYDPEAVTFCEETGLNNFISVNAGGKTDNLSGAPFHMEGRVILIGNGTFQEAEPRHGGQTNYNMGRITIVETKNGSTLMLTSRRIPPFSLNQLTTFGIQPDRYDVIIAKGVQAPVAAYAPVCPSIIRVNTPGVTCADATRLHFENRRKPLFPFEDWMER